MEIICHIAQQQCAKQNWRILLLIGKECKHLFSIVTMGNFMFHAHRGYHQNIKGKICSIDNLDCYLFFSFSYQELLVCLLVMSSLIVTCKFIMTDYTVWLLIWKIDLLAFFHWLSFWHKYYLQISAKLHILKNFSWISEGIWIFGGIHANCFFSEVHKLLITIIVWFCSNGGRK